MCKCFILNVFLLRFYVVCFWSIFRAELRDVKGESLLCDVKVQGRITSPN